MANQNNHNGAAVKPSTMNYKKLRSRKTYFGLTNAKIAERAAVCEKTVSAFLCGDDSAKPETQDAICAVLKVRRKIDFEPLEIDCDFAESVAGSGIKYSIRWEHVRSVWSIIQEGPLESRAVGEFYGIEAEAMARCCAATLQQAVNFK